MKKKNIFQNRSQQLLALFEKAGSRAKMMCVPIDYAKMDRGFHQLRRASKNL
jgi:hypothetical protein